MAVGNPFNTGQVARPSELVNRTKEHDTFETYLDSTTRRSPMSVAICGIRGIGKTSLLAKFEEYAIKKNCIVLRLEAEEGKYSSVVDLYSEILSMTNAELTKRSMLKILSGKVSGFVNSFSFTLTHQESGLGLKVEGKKAKDELMPMIFREKMLQIWDNIKAEVPAVIIMIDEAEFLEEIKGGLMALRNTFSRLGEKECGYMLVLSGRLTFHKEMNELFSPLTRFFHPMELKPLSENDVKQLFLLHLKKTNVKIADDCIRKITEDSEGHPYVLLVIGHVLFNQSKEKEEIQLDLYKENFGEILNYLAVELFDGMYGKLSAAEKTIVSQIARLGGSARVSELVKAMKTQYGALSPYLKSLVRKGSLIKVTRGEYKIFHKLYSKYVLGAYEKEE